MAEAETCALLRVQVEVMTSRVSRILEWRAVSALKGNVAVAHLVQLPPSDATSTTVRQRKGHLEVLRARLEAIVAAWPRAPEFIRLSRVQRQQSLGRAASGS